MRSRRLALSTLTAGLLATAAMTASTSAGPPAAWTDISETERGRSSAARAAALFDDARSPVPVADLRSLALPNGDVVVLPRWVAPAALQWTQVVKNGRPGTAAEASIVVGRRTASEWPHPGVAGHLAGTVAAAPFWQPYDSGCFAWLRHGGSFMAPCYYAAKLMNDGNASRDYFSLRQKASIGTDRAGSANWDGWLASIRTTGSAVQAWEDWDPGSEVRGGCSTYNATVEVKLISIGISASACDRWEPGLDPDPGRYRVKWNCDCFLGIASLRQVASNIAVSTGQGRYPSWTLSAGFTGG